MLGGEPRVRAAHPVAGRQAAVGPVVPLLLLLLRVHGRLLLRGRILLLLLRRCCRQRLHARRAVLHLRRGQPWHWLSGVPCVPTARAPTPCHSRQLLKHVCTSNSFFIFRQTHKLYVHQSYAALLRDLTCLWHSHLSKLYTCAAGGSQRHPEQKLSAMASTKPPCMQAGAAHEGSRSAHEGSRSAPGAPEHGWQRRAWAWRQQRRSRQLRRSRRCRPRRAKRAAHCRRHARPTGGSAPARTLVLTHHASKTTLTIYNPSLL